MKREFKVGDWVKVVMDKDCAKDTGRVFCIEEIKYYDGEQVWYYPSSKSELICPFFYESELSLVKSKKKVIKDQYTIDRRWVDFDLQLKKRPVGRPKGSKNIKKPKLTINYLPQEVTFKITRLEDGIELIYISMKEWDQEYSVAGYRVFRKVKK